MKEPPKKIEEETVEESTQFLTAKAAPSPEASAGEFTRFLESSHIARTVRPDACVVMKRMRMSPTDLYRIKESGAYEAGVINTASCELEIGGQVVAVGKIVRRRKKSYLKITEAPADGPVRGGGQS